MNGERILPDLKLTGLTADSRKVGPGFLFAAVPGTRRDGRNYIRDALARGAIAVLAPPDVTAEAVGPDVTLIHDANPRRRLARMAARFYAPQPDTCVAVTGTNGKTSVAEFVRQLWQAAGQDAVYVGTLGVRGGGFDASGGLTTPDPVELHRLLGDIRRAGINRVAMEASSHGLDMHRLDGVGFAAAAFTNLSRDHLDYHGTMEAYRAAKLRLFEELLTRGGTAVINAAALEFDTIANIAAERRLRVIAYGVEHGQIRCTRWTPRETGFDIELDVFGERYAIDFPLPGRFQLENALAALGLVMATGSEAAHAAPLLAQLSGVRGRLERAALMDNGAQVFVDYAHTPDALANVLSALRPHVSGRLFVVFGAGGDRDPGKRPLMGQAAAEHADIRIVTDDNPRGEAAATIRRQILDACPDAMEIGDRREAIDRAVRALGPGDVLCIAGKGHEQGQIVADRVVPFDDVTVARECIAEIDGGHP